MLLQQSLNSETPQKNDAVTSIAWPRKVNVIGVNVSCVDYTIAVNTIIQAAKAGLAGVVSCHAVHAIVTMSCNNQLREMANQFTMITPDGQPVRWAMNLLHRTGMRERVYGPELMLRICAEAANQQVPIYLYGGNPHVAAELPQSLQRQFPGLIVAGSEDPPFRALTEEERLETCNRINQSGAGIVFIGLGCPKQDIFAFENKDLIRGIQVCVGAAFDFHAGAKPMAPQWMQRNGLEWLFRLVQEPKRLWRRYLETNSIFVYRTAKQWMFGARDR